METMAGNRGSCGPVLIADDDHRLLVLVRESLLAAGYAVRAAASGEEAVELAAGERLGGAVVDVNLPVLSGYEVCRELRRLHGPTLPIVFISGDRTEVYDRVGGMLLGADDYVVKPFDAHELVERLDSLVDRAAPTWAKRTLTPRELQVLTLLSEGLAQLEIADRLEIRPKTVATHIERILSKLGVRSRAQAVALAYRDTLVALSA
jgi:DNA-binding NarL/FixJ family response regulator